MNERPSISRIVTTDYIAFVGFLVPIVSAAMLAILVLLQSENTTDFAWIALIIAIAAFVVMVWRIRLISAVFEDGIAAPGTISGIYFFRDRGRIEYVYTYGGQKLISGNAIHKTKQTEALQSGAQVTVVVDRNNSKRAFVRQLYV